MDFLSLKGKINPLDLSAPLVYTQATQAYFDFYGLNRERHYPGIKHFFGSADSTGYQIACHYFEYPSATQQCFIVHGYYDHSGLFSHVVEMCLAQRCSVVLFDLPGHGLSSGDVSAIRDFSDYRSVLQDLITRFKAHSELPINVIAQSTGAAVVMDYLLTEKSPVFEKQVLLAPLVWPVKWRQSMWLYQWVKPFLKTVPRHFAESSHDPAFLDFIKNRDPFQSRILSLQWVGALKKWISHFQSLPENQQLTPLIIQGDDDQTVDWRRNLPLIESKFPQAKTVYLEGAGHHLVNEIPELRKQMAAAIKNYLDD